MKLFINNRVEPSSHFILISFIIFNTLRSARVRDTVIHSLTVV